MTAEDKASINFLKRLRKKGIRRIFQVEHQMQRLAYSRQLKYKMQRAFQAGKKSNAGECDEKAKIKRE